MKAFRSIFMAFFYNRIRDKGFLFWTLMFPIMFMVIFGFAFGNEASFSMTGNTEGSLTPFGVFFGEGVSPEIRDTFLDTCSALSLEPFQAKSVADLKTGVEQSANSIVFGVHLESDADGLSFHMVLNAGRQNQNPLYQSYVQNLSQEMVKRLAGFNQLLAVEMDDVTFTQKKVTSLGYIIAGVISVSISFAGLSSLIVSFGYYRKDGVIKRLLATPLDGSIFLFGDVFNTFLTSALSVGVIMLLAVLIFQIQYTILFLPFVFSFLSSMLVMMGIGGFFLVAFREPNAAMNLSNIMANIMIFFSGVYFPLQLLPDWLQNVAGFLPMTYVAKMMRYSLGQDIMPVGEFWLTVLVFFAIGLFMIPWMGTTIFRREME
ncbi:MAG TPA: ABC transporter permease [Thermotogota bacterium]|nr:ABC transporter permease [Thermotogota bacterium]HRW92165.1 ABC transporter permease [Thermotogota bacterium]